MYSSSTDLNVRLQRLGFTPEDLAANRSGVLTERQQQEVAYRQRIYVKNGRIAMLVMWGGFSLLIVGWQVVSLLTGSLTMERFTAELPYVGIALAGMTGCFGFAFIWGLIGGRDLMNGKISVVEGRARVRVREIPGRYQNYPRCEVKIGGRTFLLAERNQFDVFEDGVSYRVFHIRFRPLHIILSAEVL